MGKIYMNSVSSKNELMCTNLNDYEKLVKFCKELKDIFKDAKIFIYKDKNNYFEIDRKDLE